MNKICFISPKAYALYDKSLKFTFGGAETQLSLLANELAKRENLKMHMMVADYGQESVELINKVHLWKSLNLQASKIKQIMSFAGTFFKINADIYVQRTLRIESFFIALICRILNKKFVYMVAHDHETDEKFLKGKNYLSKKLLLATYKLAHLTIVQNKYQWKNISQITNKDNHKILKKGLLFPNLKNNKKSKIYDGIWIGRCVEWKRPEKFIELSLHNPHLKFLMICPKATDGQKYFQYLREKTNAISNLEFLDFVPNHKISDFLLRSRVFCFTSEKEGDWPMAVLEAASASIPILSYTLNYEGLIDTFQGGICCNGNLELMSEKLNGLISNKPRLKKYGEAALSYVLKNHDIQKNSSSFWNMLLKI